LIHKYLDVVRNHLDVIKVEDEDEWFKDYEVTDGKNTIVIVDLKLKSPYFSKLPRVLSTSSGLLKVPDSYLLH
jgi:dTDP-4-dehydrorhamnose 3,5-epimerase-like enzyme